MSTQVMHFHLYGNDYESMQFTAVRAISILRDEKTNPVELLRLTSIVPVGADPVPLNSRAAINAHVKDPFGMVTPIAVLAALVVQVRNVNFGFMQDWSGVKIPKRFRGESEPVESSQVDPVISQLLQGEAATLRELEEYYSLEDAFKMLDVIATKSLNNALSAEAARKKSK